MNRESNLLVQSMLGTYPKTASLKEKRVTIPGIELQFAPIDVAQKGFRGVVRDQKYDLAELAIVTFLLAHAAGKPYVLLPFVMNGQFHHKSIWCRVEDALTPKDLEGKRVGMRSYSQTTPTWVRGILAEEYGVDLGKVHWLSQEGAHVAEYTDPPWVEPLAVTSNLEELLLDGVLDAVITGSGVKGEGRLQRLLPDPEQAALRWHERYHVVPINHMVVVRKEFAGDKPEMVRRIFEALVESRMSAASPEAGKIDLQPVGFANVIPGIEMVMRFAVAQGLIPQCYPVESLFGPVLKALPQ